MVDFRIDVVIDPAKSTGGAKRVEQQLVGLQADAAELRKALVDALAIRDTGTAATLGRIETILGRTEEQAISTGARIGQIGRDLNDRGVRRLNAELDKTATKAKSIGPLLQTAFAGVGAALLAREFVQLSDAVTNTQNRLRLVTSSAEELADTQRRLFEISNATRSSFTSTAEVFNRLAVSAKELGVTNSQLLDFTQSLNQAVILSGASASEASAGLIQLSQGLASGALRGDELRSVLEQLPAVADVIAKSLGVTRGELRQLGQDGAITAKVVLDAFAAARGELNDRFATTVPTIGQAFTVLGSKITEAVGKFNEGTGVAGLFAKALLVVGDNLTVVVSGVGTLVAAFATFKAVSFVSSLTDIQTKSLKAAGAIGLLATTVSALGSIYQSIEDDQAGAAEAVRNLAEDSKFVDGFARQIVDLQRTINNLRREAQTSPTGKLAEEIDTLTRRLQFFQAEQKRTATEQLAAQRAGVEARTAARAAAKADEETLARQSEVLEKIRKPFEDYVQLQRDLSALLAANKITQAEFNIELAKAKPPEQKSPEEKKKEADPKQRDLFREELDAIREQNTELLIRSQNFGIQREALLIENELAKNGVVLTREQQLALAEQLIKRKELVDQQTAQTEKEKQLAELTARRATLIDNLNAEINANAIIAEQIRELIALKGQEGVANETVDKAVTALRLKQLEAATDLGSGFERAFLKIKAEAEDLAAVGEQVVNVFANTAADAIATFVTTGKLNFKEFATSILADITRIIARLLVVQAINAVVGAVSGTGNLGAAAGGAANAGLNAGRAGGGTVQPGQRAFPVGEQGPELFVPRQTGTIVPNAQSVPAAPPQVNVQVVNVTDPAAVPSAINNGLADESIVNVLNRKREAVRQLLS